VKDSDPVRESELLRQINRAADGFNRRVRIKTEYRKPALRKTVHRQNLRVASFCGSSLHAGT
jgi:hypothetical protein